LSFGAQKDRFAPMTSQRTNTVLALLLPLVLHLALLQSCAHFGEDKKNILSEITVLTEEGVERNLGYALGKITVVDICAAWSNACLHNATMMDKACVQLCGDDVEMMSILLDDLHEAALHSYRNVLMVHQKLYTPSEDFRTGKTPLGPLRSIPRLLIFDRQGRLVKDIEGAVISAEGLVQQILKLR
jgi:hypothetical protein